MGTELESSLKVQARRATSLVPLWFHLELLGGKNSLRQPRQLATQAPWPPTALDTNCHRLFFWEACLGGGEGHALL